MAAIIDRDGCLYPIGIVTATLSVTKRGRRRLYQFVKLRYSGNMATATDEVIDVIRRPDLHPKEQLIAAERMIRDRLIAPLTSEDAATVLGVTRPTVHAWVKAGLLRRSGPTGHRLALDTAVVYKVAAILETHRLHSISLADKAEALRSLLDEITIGADPSLERALGEAERGEFIPYKDDHLPNGRRKVGRAAEHKAEIAR